MKKLNQIGFSLSEVLVTIVILGIVSLISIPIIRNVQASSQEKKYIDYGASMISAAKLYNDSYSEDLFGRRISGCEIVDYSRLVEKNLLEDISLKDVSCNSEYSYVKIIKLDNEYAYTYYLGCGEKNEENTAPTEVTTTFPDKTQAISKETLVCSNAYSGSWKVTATNINIAGNADKFKKYNAQKRSEKVGIISATGINSNMEIYTTWSTAAYDPANESTYKWEKASIKVEKNQREQLLKGTLTQIEATSAAIQTTKDMDGKYYFIIRVKKLSDLYGESYEGETYQSFGPYAVDTTKPNVSDLSIKSKTEEYNNLNVEITLNATDNHTSQKNLKVCISEEATCTNSDDYVSYEKEGEPITLEYKVSGSYDQKERKINIFVKDAAGNTIKKTLSYTVAQKWTITYNVNGGVACSPTKKSVYINKGDTKTWGDLCVPTRTNYTFKRWKDSSGTTITKDTEATKNLTVTADWRLNRVYIQINMNGGSLADPHGAKYGSSGSHATSNSSTNIHTISYGGKLSTSGLINWNNSSALNVKRAGYRAVSGAEYNTKSDGSGTSYNQTTQYNASDFCDASEGDCTVVLYINWVGNKVKIKLNMNSGSLSSSHGESYGTSGNLITKNSSTIIHTINYGSSLGSNGLANWNNASAINITRTGYQARDGAEWILSGGTKTYNQDTIYSASDFCDASEDDCTVTLKVNWRSNKVKIQLHMNGGALLSTHGSSISASSVGYLTKNGSYTIHEINYGGSLGSNGLADYDDPSFINIYKTGKMAKMYAEWNTNSSGTGSSYNQYLNYNASDFCDASEDDCTVTLYANWDVSKIFIKLDMNGGSLIDPHASQYSSNGSNVVHLGYEFVHYMDYNVYINDSWPINDGLADYNNPNYLNIARSGYHGKSGAEWNSNPNGTGTSYNQATNYHASDFCNISYGYCIITLYVNWEAD